MQEPDSPLIGPLEQAVAFRNGMARAGLMQSMSHVHVRPLPADALRVYTFEPPVDKHRAGHCVEFVFLACLTTLF